MDNKLFLYGYTVCRMKPGQVLARVGKLLRLKRTLGVRPVSMPKQLCFVSSLEALDGDPAFLSRFSPEELLGGSITLLHRREAFSGQDSWVFPRQTPLWHYQLHGFEYTMPVLRRYRETGDPQYLQWLCRTVDGWIRQNPRRQGGLGWDPYPIAMRSVYWLILLRELNPELSRDFRERMRASLYEQYVFLAEHLETDLLANHYFENLKALILCAIAFQDERMRTRAVSALKKQCRQQILGDGTHCERSPMYHNLMLEALIRVCVALRGIGQGDVRLEDWLQPMLDAAWTLEGGLSRLPLFHDGGNNMAKSLDALTRAAETEFALVPRKQAHLPQGGYYFLTAGDWKLVADGGSPAPRYNPGHAHCSAMSFELFFRGEPVLVNCGTYAYQGADRSYFRGTLAHNTVMADDTEQSQCWGAFRMARGSRVQVTEVTAQSLTLRLRDAQGVWIHRRILLTPQRLEITDQAPGHRLQACVHALSPQAEENLRVTAGEMDWGMDWYAPEYGSRWKIPRLQYWGQDSLTLEFELTH